jgi:hypothetical protein
LGTLPFSAPHEYSAASSVEEYCSVPVLLSPSQRYTLLTELITTARKEIGGLKAILLRLCGPDFQLSLPVELLARDVLLTYDPDALVSRLNKVHAGGVLTIWQDLRVDTCAAGTNEISVAIHDEDHIPQFMRFLKASTTIASLSACNETVLVGSHAVTAGAIA